MFDKLRLNRIKMSFEWEQIETHTRRAKVIGGWIVETVNYCAGKPVISTIFIPDRKHKWEIEK